MRWIIALALVCAQPALGAEWLKFCDSNRSTDGLSPGEWACASVTTNSDDTDPIAVGACNNIDVAQFADPDDDGTDSTITGQLQLCRSDTGSDNTCFDATGISAMSGDDVDAGLGAISWVRVQAGGTANDTVEWHIKCAHPAAR